ncbi:MAG: hypothetical protein ACRDGW_04290, partial [Actinomycetota bacterium]
MTRARPGALVASFALAIAIAAYAAVSGLAQPEPPRSALVVFVPDVSFEELLGSADVASLARAGGAALLSNPEDAVAYVDPAVPGEVRSVLDTREPGALQSLVERHRSLFSRDDEL